MPFYLLLGRLPFVRSDRSDHSRRNDNFRFNQNSPARSVKSWIVCTKEMIFQQKLLKKAYFIFKLTGRAMVRPASSDKWKAPLVNPFTANNSLRTQTYLGSSLLSSVFAGCADKSQSKKIYKNKNSKFRFRKSLYLNSYTIQDFVRKCKSWNDK